MDNFKVIYRILKHLEASIDNVYTDIKAISNVALNISYERWEYLMIELQISGYIRGLVFEQSMGDNRAHLVEPINPIITLKGLEYLSENTTMKKVGNTLRGLKEIIPGM